MRFLGYRNDRFLYLFFRHMPALILFKLCGRIEGQPFITNRVVAKPTRFLNSRYERINLTFPSNSAATTTTTTTIISVSLETNAKN